jgi:hypothetical protein
VLHFSLPRTTFNNTIHDIQIIVKNILIIDVLKFIILFIAISDKIILKYFLTNAIERVIHRITFSERLGSAARTKFAWVTATGGQILRRRPAVSSAWQAGQPYFAFLHHRHICLWFFCA